MWRRRALLATAAVAAAGGTAAQAGATRIVVGFAPGGGNDTLARLLAERLRDVAGGSPVVVENRPGANGVLAAEAVRHAAPDGRTLLVGPISTMVMNPVLLRSVPYDPAADFAPVAIVGHFPLVVCVTPALPVHTLAELLAAARARPGGLDYSSGASSFRLATEMLAQRAGVALNHVPYRGSAPAALAVATGEVAMTLGDVSAVLPLIQAGRLRALAVTTPERIPGLPEVPTVGEAGVPGYAMVFWSGLFAPEGTPAAALAALEGAVLGALADPGFRERLRALGVEPAGAAGAAVRALIRAQVAAFAEVARRGGIEPE